MRPVVIAGGGISGLSAAWHLRKARIPFVIVEPDRLGGIIRTDSADGCLIEAGPDSFLTAKPWARELAAELGLEGELIGSNQLGRGTYVVRNGGFVRMPEGLAMMAPTRLAPLVRSRLIGVGAKFRGAIELLRRPKGEREDRSVAEFVLDHYGRDVLDYIAEPLLAGVYGGDPRELSARSVIPKLVEWESKYGSVTRGARIEASRASGPVFTTFRRGMGSFVDALVARLQPDVIPGRVEKIEKGWRARVNGDWIEASSVVIACRAEDVLPGLFPPIPYNDATVLGLVYASNQIARALDAFGFLVPKVERRHVSACTWVNAKFEGRAAEGRVVLRCFAVGKPESAEAELRERMGITGDPLWRKASFWPRAMPQYTVGHEEKVRMIEGMLRDLPGLHVAGNAYHGVGVPDCIRSGKEAAERIAAGNGII